MSIEKSLSAQEAKIIRRYYDDRYQYIAHKLEPKNCGTCKFWDREHLHRPDYPSAKCIYALPPLPESVNHIRYSMGEKYGTKCEVWAARS